MARKKAAAKQSVLPKGYTSISGFGKSWPNDDTKKGDMILGVIEEYDEIEVVRKRNGRNVKESVQNVKIETDSGVVTLWESAGLKPLFEYAEGTEVCVIFEGMGVAKKGQNAPRLYTIGVNEE